PAAPRPGGADPADARRAQAAAGGHRPAGGDGGARRRRRGRPRPERVDRRPARPRRGRGGAAAHHPERVARARRAGADDPGFGLVAGCGVVAAVAAVLLLCPPLCARLIHVEPAPSPAPVAEPPAAGWSPLSTPATDSDG